MIEHAYRGQFLSKRDEPKVTDGRDILLSDLRKLHRLGPSQPTSLAKHDRGVPDADAQIRKMSRSDADRVTTSFDVEALDAVKKRTPIAPGKLFDDSAPELIKGGARLRKHRLNIDLSKLTLPSQSSNAESDDVNPSRWGSTRSDSGYRDGPEGNRPSQVPPPSSSAISSPQRSPQDDDAWQKAYAKARANPQQMPLR